MKPSERRLAVPGRRLEFVSHDVRSLLSVAHLFPRSKGRRGIYVLSFEDGEQYVGQTVNIVGRFVTHRDRWPDVVRLNFAQVPHGDLNEPERKMIHRSQDDGKTLRNITYALGAGKRSTPPDLDYSVTEQHQYAWLAGGDPGPDAATRVNDPVLRANSGEKFARLMRHPLGETAVALAQMYVQLALLQPRATEMTFWAVSAMPATNSAVHPRLLAISVNKMETFVLGWDKDDPDALWGFMNVSRKALADESGPIARYRWSRRSRIKVRGGHYESGGGDVVALNTRSASAMRAALTESSGGGAVQAARSLNLQLMRKGPTLQWRWHNFQLADRLLAPIPMAEAE